MGLRRASGPIGAALGTALAVATLPGCGNQPTEPKPLENKADSQPDPTTPPTTPTTPPESPGGTWEEPAPFQTTPGEPEQFGFIRHYFDLVSQARRTGDPQPFLELSAPDCKSCPGMADVIKEFHAGGGSREGDDRWRVKSINEMPRSDKGQGYLVSLQIDPHEIRPSAGAIPTPVKTDSFVNEVYLEEGGDSWLVAEIIAPSD